ncbi:MAG: hypothetical protein GY807_16195 [Gammaproteobacteria bacterium]|nr:hypothetical protein [Gammaproteobacteria bacterium]
MADNETPVGKGVKSDKQASVKKKATGRKASPIKKAAPKKKSAPQKKPTPKKKPIPKKQAEKEAADQTAAKQKETHKVSPDQAQQAPVAANKEAVTPPSTDSSKKKKFTLRPWIMLLALVGAAFYLLNNLQRIEDKTTSQSPAPAAAKKDTQSIAPSPLIMDENPVPTTENTDTTAQAKAEQISPTQGPEKIQSESTESLVITSTQSPDTTTSEDVISLTEEAIPAETSEVIDIISPPAPGAEKSPSPQLETGNLELVSRESNLGTEVTAIEPSVNEQSVTAIEPTPGEKPVGTAPIEASGPEDQAQGPVGSSPERPIEGVLATEPKKTKAISTQQPPTPPAERASTAPPASSGQGATASELKPITAEDISDARIAKTISPQAAKKPPLKSATRGNVRSPNYLERPANAWTRHWQARRQYRTPHHYRRGYSHGEYYPYGYYYGRRAPYRAYNPYFRHWQIPKGRD